MAQIAINSMNVIQACDKAVENLMHLHKSQSITYGHAYMATGKIETIKKLSQFSEKFGILSITIDHDDFQLIGEFLTIPTDPKP